MTTTDLKTDLNKTPLYQQHRNLNAKIVNFGGWALPVNYGSQIAEHKAVREQCGVFDVSHMCITDISGEQTLPFLRQLLANDINKVTSTPGKAIYSCMLNEQGGVIDDLIVYYLTDTSCRMVSNAGTRDKVRQWLTKQSAAFEVELVPHNKLAIIAVQGPSAIKAVVDTIAELASDEISQLARFQSCSSGDLFIGRTGYTGEDGLELIVPDTAASSIWQKLIAAGVQPCGLGARDTLRLEAGMALYGNDLDESHTPIESGLNWTVNLTDERDFIGKAALVESPRFKQVGLILQGKGVLRSHLPISVNGTVIGETTSGTFSPSLQKSIAMARINNNVSTDGKQLQVEIRNRLLDVSLSKLPFYRS